MSRASRCSGHRSYIDGVPQRKPLTARMLALGGNTLVQPLPRLGLADPVGSDIQVGARVRARARVWVRVWVGMRF